MSTRSSSANRRANYVVLEDGTLRLGAVDNNAIGGGHIDLAAGQPVRAAGEVRFVKGKVHSINNKSGHYQPHGPAAQAAAEDAFRNAGFDVDGKYIELQF